MDNFVLSEATEFAAGSFSERALRETLRVGFGGVMVVLIVTRTGRFRSFEI